MAFVSVTRLRLASARFVAPFVLDVVASTRQVRRSPGFLGGRLMSEPGRGFWTVTVWEDAGAMRNYRGEQAHRRAMPKLRRWCDEASVVHWEQESREPPPAEEARRRMVSEGRLSRVDRPSAAHGDGRIDASPVRDGPSLTPKG